MYLEHKLTRGATLYLLFCVEELLRYEKKNKNFPTMEVIEQLSAGGEMYQWVCFTFMKCVVGSNQWARRANKELLSEVTAESDESFVLLTLENNYFT